MTTLDAAMELLGGLVLDDGRRWGDVAAPVQWTDARAVLDPGSRTPYHFLTRSRGYHKTGDGAGSALAVMLSQLPPASRLYALASDRDQGRLVVDSVAGFVARTPGLSSAVRVDGYRATALRSGSTLEVLAADAPGSWGLRPAFLVVDELSAWADTLAPRQLWDATTSALAKIPGARLLVLSTSGDPSHWSYKVLEHARRDPLWNTHEVSGPPPWADPARLAEQRRRLSESMYLRLFENRWVAAEDRLVRPDDLAACVRPDDCHLEARSGVRYRVGVDLGIKGDATAIAVVHEETDGVEQRIVADRMLRFRGTAANPVQVPVVEEAILQASEAYRRAPVSLDPWQMIGSAQRLRAQGITVEEFNFSAQSVGRLATTLHTLVRDHRISLSDDPELLDELGRVKLREVSPGVLRMDHAAGDHDDQAVAIALAALPFVERGPRRPGRAINPGRYEGAGALDRAAADSQSSHQQPQRRRGNATITSPGSVGRGTGRYDEVIRQMGRRVGREL
jgi:phage terminase large subunit-like protein